MATRTTKSNPNQNGRADHAATPFGLDESRIRDAHADHMATDVPPHDLELEKCIFGAVLLNPSVIPTVQAILGTTDVFHSPRHRIIWTAMVALHESGSGVDPMLLRSALERRGELEDAGGVSVLRGLMEVIHRPDYALDHARIVRDKFDLRRAGEIGRELVRLSMTPGAVPSEIVSQCEASFASLSESRLTQGKFPAISLGVLLAKEFPPSQWIAEGFIREHETCFWIAPEKSLKTTLLMSLAVTAASGGTFLNRFPSHACRRVLLLLGETEEGYAMPMLRLACEARGIDPATIADAVYIHCGALPQVSSAADLSELSRLCEKHRPDLIILDPFYLAADGLELSRLEVVGPRIRAIGDAVKPGTLVIVHHTTKGESRQVGKVLNMGSGTGTGFQAACGQWVIVNREEEYDPQTSDWHVLNMNWGGRGGHGGRLLIRYRESTGEVESELMGSREDQREQREQERTSKKIAERETRMNSARNVLTGILLRSETPMSKRAIEAELQLSASDWTAVGQTLCRAAIKDMELDLTILECEYRVKGKLREGFIHRDDRQRFVSVPGLSILDPDPTIAGDS